jgi:molybdenum cofactor biosynthesis enzyme MoaA
MVLRKELIDSFGRFHSYLRISLTEKCNLRCQYCMPEHGVNLTPKQSLLTLAERFRIVSVFQNLGVTKLRFTGGEPTISNQLCPLIEHSSKDLGIQSIGITTNGIMLKEQLTRLLSAGLTSVNVSLDTLDPVKFASITRRDQKLFYKVQSSIFETKAKNLPLKINCVLMRGINEMEVRKFIDYAMEYDLTVRFIELMPFDGNQWNSKQFISYVEVLDRLKRDFVSLFCHASPSSSNHFIIDAIKQDIRLVKDISAQSIDKSDTTKWYRIEGSATGKVGFITSMSRYLIVLPVLLIICLSYLILSYLIFISSNFCGSCNRLRITADGNLKVCLFGEEGFSFRDALRKGLSEEEIYTEIHNAILKKKFALGGHIDVNQLAAASNTNRPMILIGG